MNDMPPFMILDGQPYTIQESTAWIKKAIKIVPEMHVAEVRKMEMIMDRISIQLDCFLRNYYANGIQSKKIRALSRNVKDLAYQLEIKRQTQQN